MTVTPDTLLKRAIAKNLRRQAKALFDMAKELDPPEPDGKRPRLPKHWDENTVDWVREMEDQVERDAHETASGA